MGQNSKNLTNFFSSSENDLLCLFLVKFLRILTFSIKFKSNTMKNSKNLFFSSKAWKFFSIFHRIWLKFYWKCQNPWKFNILNRGVQSLAGPRETKDFGPLFFFPPKFAVALNFFFGIWGPEKSKFNQNLWLWF
jgi:hypothetical protein